MQLAIPKIKFLSFLFILKKSWVVARRNLKCSAREKYNFTNNIEMTILFILVSAGHIHTASTQFVNIWKTRMETKKKCICSLRPRAACNVELQLYQLLFSSGMKNIWYDKFDKIPNLLCCHLKTFFFYQYHLEWQLISMPVHKALTIHVV